MLNYLFHFFTGYVIIKIEGKNKENFINMCAAEKLPIRNIKCHGRLYSSGEIKPSLYHRLKLSAKDSGCKIGVLKRGGLPFFLLRLKKRKIFCFGFIIALLLLVWLCSRIWVIDILETDPLKRAEISQILENKGILCGMPANKIKPFDFQQEVLAQYPGYTRFWLEKKGTKLSVDIRYAKPTPAVDSPYSICNIVAKNSGIIKKIVARRGNSKVLENTYVKKGDILISGIVTNPTSGALYVKADGDIYAEVSYTFEKTASLNSVKRVKTGNISKKYVLEFLGKSFNLFLREPAYSHYDGTITDKSIKFFGEYFLPVKLRTYTYHEVSLKPQVEDAETLEKNLKTQLEKSATLKIPEKNIISKDFKTNITNGDVTVTFNVTALENIATSEEITYESTPFVVSDINKKAIVDH